MSRAGAVARRLPDSMNGDEPRVGVLFGGVEHVWTLEEWLAIRRVADAVLGTNVLRAYVVRRIAPADVPPSWWCNTEHGWVGSLKAARRWDPNAKGLAEARALTKQRGGRVMRLVRPVPWKPDRLEALVLERTTERGIARADLQRVEESKTEAWEQARGLAAQVKGLAEMIEAMKGRKR